MTTTQTKIEAAHATTPTCNAAATQPFHCHSLACRTKAFGAIPVQPEWPAPVSQDIVRAELSSLLERAIEAGDAAADFKHAAMAGTFEAGIETILIRCLGMKPEAVAALAGGRR